MAVMLTTSELAREVGVKPGTIWAWIRRNKLVPAARLGHIYLWPVPLVAVIQKIKLDDRRRRGVARG
jgi:hypothetical protein